MGRLCVLLILVAVGIACGSCTGAVAKPGVATLVDARNSPADESRLDEEAGRRLDEVFKQGFYFGYDVTTAQRVEKIELLVGPLNEENAISLWLETAYGTFEMELTDPSGQLVASWRGRRGEQRLGRALVPGKYVLELHALDGARVHGVIGVKGPATQICRIDAGRLSEHPADPAHGYAWPYLLARPTSSTAEEYPRSGFDRLLIVPNNTGVNEDPGVLREAAICTLTESDIKPLELADKLGTLVLVPLFPRPELRAVASNLELQALTRASLEVKEPTRFARVDLQLIAMIDAARKEMADHGQPLRESVLMVGFSASGGFTNRFTMLHPERVFAAAVGSPVGWPIAPVTSDQGKTLRYPVGVADIQDFTGRPIDLVALRGVHFLFFLGEADTNDAVGYSDSYATNDSQLIQDLFGKTLIVRWQHAEQLYKRAGLDQAQFKVYPGRHEITAAIWNDILDVFRKALKSSDSQ